MADKDELCGRRLQGYKVLDRLKEGSVGAVYLAGKDDRLVALKMIYEKHLSNPERLSRFRREAKVALSLSHPNVIRTFEYYDGPPRPFLVMEYFPSENLKQWEVHQAGRLANFRYSILRQIAEGLLYCHGQGVVHRDIKPENILVNDNMKIKIIDFSISTTKVERFFSFLGRRTAGSPNYMAPEQIKNLSVDARTDLYSYGVLAFELLTGSLPFYGTSTQEVLVKHCTASVPRASRINDKIPGEVCDLLDQLLAKKPESRPQDIGKALYIFGKKERETAAA